MAVRIRLAETVRDLDALFSLRHRVFVEEKGWFPPEPDGRITDLFDVHPTTANIVAVVDRRVVGGARFVEAGALGMPSDRFFDFSPFVPPGAKVGSGSMLCVEPEQRDTPRLVSAMIGMGYYWALARGLSHLVCPMNPGVAPIFLPTGARPVAPEFIHEPTRLPVLPVVFDLARLDERFLAFARRQQIDHRFYSFERQFHCAGETIVRQEDQAATAFVIVGGDVEVGAKPSDGPVEPTRLSRGDSFGELALLTGRPHPADVVAVTDVDLMLMVLEPGAFQARLQSDPEMPAPVEGATRSQAGSVSVAHWPERRGRPRVLVEGAAPTWHPMLEELFGDHYELASCAGPQRVPGGCPLVEGRGCSLAQDADLIVNCLDLDRAANREVLPALRTLCPQVPVMALTSCREAHQHQDCLHGHRVETLPTSGSELRRLVADSVPG